MILLWLVPALLVTLGALLWMIRKPDEFGTIERRESAMEVLRDINPRWVPPEIRKVPRDPLYTFDDPQEV